MWSSIDFIEFRVKIADILTSVFKLLNAGDAADAIFEKQGSFNWCH